MNDEDLHLKIILDGDGTMMGNRVLVRTLVLAGSLFGYGIGDAKDAIQPGESIGLFNGGNLDGWYTYLKARGRDVDPLQVFTVQDGMIRISGEEWGCITTRDRFENYRLIVEYKWGELTHGNREKAARDSGVLLHSNGEDGAYAGVWMYSIEAQVIEGGTGDLLVVGDQSDRFHITCPVADEMQGKYHVFQPDGRLVTIQDGRINWWGRSPLWEDVKGFRGERDVENPPGEWNRLECIADGFTLTLILNGVVMNKAYDVRPRAGRIQIQSEGAEIFVRRVELLPLKKE